MFTESQIIGILMEESPKMSVFEICRTYGVSRATFYRWKRKYNGLVCQQIFRLKELEMELANSKQILAEMRLQYLILKEDFERTLER